MSAGIRNVFAHHNEFGGPGLSLLKIKTNANRGGYVQNIHVRHSPLRSAISGVVQFDGNYPETVPFPNADVFNPTIRNIFLDDVDTGPTMTPAAPRSRCPVRHRARPWRTCTTATRSSTPRVRSRPASPGTRTSGTSWSTT